MATQTYRYKIRPQFEKILFKVAKELRENFIIQHISYDTTTKEFVFTIEASDNFHSKLQSYL